MEPVLHLSLAVRDLAEARAFYLDVDPSGNVIEVKSYADPTAALER